MIEHTPDVSCVVCVWMMDLSKHLSECLLHLILGQCHCHSVITDVSDLIEMVDSANEDLCVHVKNCCSFNASCYIIFKPRLTYNVL